MSTAFAIDLAADTAVRPLPARPAPPLRAAPPQAAQAPAVRTRPAVRPRVLAATALLGGVVCVVAAQLVLSIGTADGAYRLAELQQHSAVLVRQQQARQETLAVLAAPQRLAARAAAIGMVQSDSPAYLDARTGKVLGSAKRVTGTAQDPTGVVR